MWSVQQDVHANGAYSANKYRVAACSVDHLQWPDNPSHRPVTSPRAVSTCSRIYHSKSTARGTSAYAHAKIFREKPATDNHRAFDKKLPGIQAVLMYRPTGRGRYAKWIAIISPINAITSSRIESELCDYRLSWFKHVVAPISTRIGLRISNRSVTPRPVFTRTARKRTTSLFGARADPGHSTAAAGCGGMQIVVDHLMCGPASTTCPCSVGSRESTSG